MTSMLMEGSALDQLQEAKATYSVLSTEKRAALNRMLGIVLGAAYTYAEDRDQWLRFCRHDTWKEDLRNRPKEGSNDYLTWVLRFAIGSSTRKEKQKVSKFARALRQPHSEKIQPEQLPDYIKAHGGVQKMADDEAARMKLDRLSITCPAAKLKKRNRGESVRFVGEHTDDLRKLKVGREVMVRVRIASTAQRLALEVLGISEIE